MLPEIFIGVGAGLIIGTIARKKARETIARELMLGSRRLSESVIDGRTTLLQAASPQVREGVSRAIDRGIAQSGLTEMQFRVLIVQVKRLRSYL